MGPSVQRLGRLQHKTLHHALGGSADYDLAPSVRQLVYDALQHACQCIVLLDKIRKLVKDQNGSMWRKRAPKIHDGTPAPAFRSAEGGVQRRRLLLKPGNLRRAVRSVGDIVENIGAVLQAFLQKAGLATAPPSVKTAKLARGTAQQFL